MLRSSRGVSLILSGGLESRIKRSRGQRRFECERGRDRGHLVHRECKAVDPWADRLPPLIAGHLSAWMLWREGRADEGSTDGRQAI